MDNDQQSQDQPVESPRQDDQQIRDQQDQELAAQAEEHRRLTGPTPAPPQDQSATEPVENQPTEAGNDEISEQSTEPSGEQSDEQ